jgi:hypothetical protein
MQDDESDLTAFVALAAGGDQTAWNRLVGRFSPLLVAVTRQSGLGAGEGQDVVQTV